MADIVLVLKNCCKRCKLKCINFDWRKISIFKHFYFYCKYTWISHIVTYLKNKLKNWILFTFIFLLEKWMKIPDKKLTHNSQNKSFIGSNIFKKKKKCHSCVSSSFTKKVKKCHYRYSRFGLKNVKNVRHSGKSVLEKLSSKNS